VNSMLWNFITIFGDFRFWLGVCIASLLIYFTLPKRSKKHVTWTVFLLLPSIFLSYGTAYILKILFKLPRPCVGLLNCPKTYSFPSGHTTVIFTVATTFALYYKDRKYSLFMFVLASLVAVSRIMLNVHYPLDVIAGAVLGSIVGFVVFYVYMSTSYKLIR